VGRDEGVYMAGARYVFASGTEIAAVDQQSTDVFNTLFAKVEHRFKLADDRSLKLFLQYTDQRSIGDDLIGDFATDLLSAKVEYGFGQATLRAGASTTDDEKGIQKPYGNPANYLSVIVEDFDRAGEDAWMIGGNYNFGRLGPGELSTFGNIVTGDTPDSGPTASPDETEYDLTADYRIKEGVAKNLWIRVRAAYIDQDEREGGDDFLDFRIIVNWDFAAP
jgi:predicted porin